MRRVLAREGVCRSNVSSKSPRTIKKKQVSIQKRLELRMLLFTSICLCVCVCCIHVSSSLPGKKRQLIFRLAVKPLRLRSKVSTGANACMCKSLSIPQMFHKAVFSPQTTICFKSWMCFKTRPHTWGYSAATINLKSTMHQPQTVN